MEEIHLGASFVSGKLLMFQMAAGPWQKICNLPWVADSNLPNDAEARPLRTRRNPSFRPAGPNPLR
jgi:hypothetical protein